MNFKCHTLLAPDQRTTVLAFDGIGLAFGSFGWRALILSGHLPSTRSLENQEGDVWIVLSLFCFVFLVTWMIKLHNYFWDMRYYFIFFCIFFLYTSTLVWYIWNAILSQASQGEESLHTHTHKPLYLQGHLQHNTCNICLFTRNRMEQWLSRTGPLVKAVLQHVRLLDCQKTVDCF